MAFVFKRLTGDEAKTLRQRVIGSVVQFQNTCAADEAKDIDFWSLGAETEAREARYVELYNLLWADHAIAIEGEVDYAKGDDGRTLLAFNITRIRIPRALHQKVEAVWEMLTDAIAVYIGGAGRKGIQGCGQASSDDRLILGGRMGSPISSRRHYRA